jgi:exopolyphosphatase / guanosine-5'-triphosphate,3'-diphosphate pyrophosphatase
MSRAAIDIGTNSMRLLVVDDDGRDLVRVARVTGLGHGVDADRRLGSDAVERTLLVFGDFARSCEEFGVDRMRAVATSATRDAENRDEFLDRAETVLGIRPEVISGQQEAELAYLGATAGREGESVVVDIGGGSTEFVTRSGTVQATSIDIGSVRLTDRLLPDRPADFDALEAASAHVERLFRSVRRAGDSVVIGVAGTWTSLAAIEQGREGSVHDMVIRRLTADRLVGRLASLTVEQTAALPGLDPARAPVILGGAVIAREAMRALGTDEVVVSERDLLDGIVAGL